MRYTTYGSVRGCCGHAHRDIIGARKCLERDAEGCRAQGVYSDRGVRQIDSRAELTSYDVTRGPGTVVPMDEVERYY
jgi:hypothetical protein